MRINQVTTFTMGLSVEEFELLHSICASLGYGYRIEDDEYIITMDEDMLDDIKYFLEREQSHQYYDECNRFAAERIGDLLDCIYYELNYND